MLFGSILSYLGCSRFLIGMGEVVGQSMWPNLVDGERFIINRLAYRMHPPEPGDVAAVQLPDDDEMIVKRVIARPGDMVRIRAGRVWVNGHALMEPYLPLGIPTLARAMRDRSYRIADNCYFVLGDNRLSSDDSRMFGAVKRDHFVGRVLVRKAGKP
jgi:signal peptidase I